MLRSFRIPALAALIASFTPLATAHSWPEELQVIGPNGSYIGDRGYTRGYVARTDPTFDGDANILWMLPSLDARMADDTVRLRINSSDLLCHPSQRTSNYTNPAYPKLKVSPGGHVAIKYLENGHVTLPWNQPGKPSQGGTVFVYGTKQPSSTELIANVLQWNAAGTGGDRRGFLMTAQTFDDGRCHQINDCVDSAIRQVLYPNKIPGQPTAPGQEQWCETDLKIPHNQTMGDLTLYWVWQWPTSPNVDCVVPTGKDEYYTSCIDVEIVQGGRGDIDIVDEFSQNTLLQENFQTKAVSTYQSRTALTTSASFLLDNWSGIRGATARVNAVFTSSCVGVLSSLALQAGVPPPSCPAGLWATGDLFASISSSVLANHVTAILTGTGQPAASASAPGTVQAPAPSAPAAITSAPPAATSAPPAPSGIVETQFSSVLATTTVTTVVTATAEVPPLAQGESQDSPQPHAHDGQQPGAAQWGPGGQWERLRTISTIGRAPAPSGQPPQDVAVGPAGRAEEHIARHRRHARHFE